MTTPADREALVKLLNRCLDSEQDSPYVRLTHKTVREAIAALTTQGGEQTADTVNVSRELLEQLRQSHEECDDCWYSCPKSGDCCNEFAGYECTCGADYFNAKIDAMLAAAKEGK